MLFDRVWRLQEEMIVSRTDHFSSTCQPVFQMAYQAIASDENTGASPLATAGATAAYPPGYETVDVESGFGSSRWFNYLYMETDSAVCQTFRIDTDLPPLPRRFANTEEQEKAANLFVNAGRTQAMVNLRGGPKAIIAIRGHHQRRRVMEIVSTALRTPRSPLC